MYCFLLIPLYYVSPLENSELFRSPKVAYLLVHFIRVPKIFNIGKAIL